MAVSHPHDKEADKGEAVVGPNGRIETRDEVGDVSSHDVHRAQYNLRTQTYAGQDAGQIITQCNVDSYKVYSACT